MGNPYHIIDNEKDCTARGLSHFRRFNIATEEGVCSCGDTAFSAEHLLYDCSNYSQVRHKHMSRLNELVGGCSLGVWRSNSDWLASGDAYRLFVQYSSSLSASLGCGTTRASVGDSA
ncbi:hypothetical protein V9T40_014688 [Parthenolecanium corni]|uniref:Uncharacterized protein n=1 Tax=Parthenolecanium corni TaxID=536013 RepID=A0AAN9XWM6_9HEMI